MGLNRTLCELPERGFFARLWVRGRCNDTAHILAELIINNRVVLVIRDAEQIFLRACRKFQTN